MRMARWSMPGSDKVSNLGWLPALCEHQQGTGRVGDETQIENSPR